MEPDVIRMYSSSPPPMDDGTEEEDSEFGDFGTYSSVPASISFTDFDTPTTFNQTQALNATSPPELLNNRGTPGFSQTSNGTHSTSNDLAKTNGIVPAGHLGGAPSDRTETKKGLSSSLDFSVSNHNGGDPEVLTNGFATFDLQESPSSRNSVHSHVKGTSVEGPCSVPVDSPDDNFADFAAFSDEGRLSQTTTEDPEIPSGGSWHTEHCTVTQGTTSEDTIRDSNRTGTYESGSDSICVPAEASEDSQNTDWGPDSERDAAFAQEHLASEVVCTNRPAALNGLDVADRDNSSDTGCGENDLSPVAVTGESDGKGSGNDTETETETSFGRPLSTDALEEYGDMSTTGSVPSPLLPGETATPADHSQLAEDGEDEDFGDFGDVSSFGGHGFADFEQLDVEQEQSRLRSSAPVQEGTDGNVDDDFGDFNAPEFHSSGNVGEDDTNLTEFPVSDSFGNFSSAAEGNGADVGWSAFGEAELQEEGESWAAAFSTEQSVTPSAGNREEEAQQGEEEWHESGGAAVREEVSQTDRQSVSTDVLVRLGEHQGSPGSAPFTLQRRCESSPRHFL